MKVYMKDSSACLIVLRCAGNEASKLRGVAAKKVEAVGRVHERIAIASFFRRNCLTLEDNSHSSHYLLIVIMVSPSIPVYDSLVWYSSRSHSHCCWCPSMCCYGIQSHVRATSTQSQSRCVEYIGNEDDACNSNLTYILNYLLVHACYSLFGPLHLPTQHASQLWPHHLLLPGHAQQQPQIYGRWPQFTEFYYSTFDSDRSSLAALYVGVEACRCLQIKSGASVHVRLNGLTCMRMLPVDFQWGNKDW